MKGAKVCSIGQAADALDCEECELWQARDHLIAASATPMRFDHRAPLFVASKSSKLLFFRKPGVLDQQTLRGVRELDHASAGLLDELLPTDELIYLIGDLPNKTAVTHSYGPCSRKNAGLCVNEKENDWTFLETARDDFSRVLLAPKSIDAAERARTSPELDKPETLYAKRRG
jgi:hypothetical protein